MRFLGYFVKAQLVVRFEKLYLFLFPFFTTFTLITPSLLAFDHQHSLWNQVVSTHVVSGRFNYQDLKSQITQSKPKPHLFQNYIQQLEKTPKSEFDTFNPNQKMAFLINAYNALTVKLILDNYPLKSIKDLGGFFSKPWSIEFFSLLDASIKSLDPIEHVALRPVFKDYRIHAAVNCASISCPELRNEAYVAEKLQTQLDEQMSLWLRDKSKNLLDDKSKVIQLSKIFDWYADDFKKWGQGIPNVLKKHAPEVYRDEVLRDYQIKFLPYDWNLNEVK